MGDTHAVFRHGWRLNVSKEWRAAEISTIRAKANALEDPDHCPDHVSSRTRKPSNESNHTQRAIHRFIGLLNYTSILIFFSKRTTRQSNVPNLLSLPSSFPNVHTSSICSLEIHVVHCHNPKTCRRRLEEIYIHPTHPFSNFTGW